MLEELARIGFSDMRRFTTWGPDGVRMHASAALDEDSARCVAEVSQTINAQGGALKFKLHDKVSALTLVGKHLGMFVDRLDHTTAGQPVTFTLAIGEKPLAGAGD